MITVLVRLRAENWDRFKRAHNAPHHIQRRRNHGNLTHVVLNQLDDANDIVYLDTWSSPQDSDEFYHSDEFHREIEQMGGDLIEIIKLEETDATPIGGPESG